MLSVLLPSGAEPIKALHAFRDRAASLLLATPGASRGLDLPAVSHVYNLAVPEDSREYVHRAGRAGRIGSMTGGVVTTLVTSEEVTRLREVVDDLGVELEVLDESVVAEGLGLLGRDWLDLRKVFVVGEGEVDQTGKSAAGGDVGQEGRKEEQLESARKGLEDLFNLL
jgi:superfamily II DNA/RNA helicase